MSDSTRLICNAFILQGVKDGMGFDVSNDHLNFFWKGCSLDSFDGENGRGRGRRQNGDFLCSWKRCALLSWDARGILRWGGKVVVNRDTDW